MNTNRSSMSGLLNRADINIIDRYVGLIFLFFIFFIPGIISDYGITYE
jgi:hypothetical protein